MTEPPATPPSGVRDTGLPRAVWSLWVILGGLIPLLWLKGAWWAAVASLAGAALITSPRPFEAVSLGLCAWGWVEWSRRSGNPELFFPFCIFLSSLAFVCVGSSDFWRGVRWSGAVLAVFLIARVWQQATPRVLWVEFLVASSLWELVMVVCRPRVPSPRWHLLVPFLASALAFLSLDL